MMRRKRYSAATTPLIVRVAWCARMRMLWLLLLLLWKQQCNSFAPRLLLSPRSTAPGRRPRHVLIRQSASSTTETADARQGGEQEDLLEDSPSDDDSPNKPPPPSYSTPDMTAFAAGMETAFQEVAFETLSSGDIPSDLQGTAFWGGPAMYSAGSLAPPRTSILQPKQQPVPDGQDADRMVLHPNEADGAVLGVTFHGKQQEEEKSDTAAPGDEHPVSMRFRYVRTVGFTNERKFGRRLYTGMDNTRSNNATTLLANDLPLPLFRHHLQPGLNKLRKATANAGVVYWGKRLLALTQGGQPYKMDALALSTEGRSRLGGAIKKDEDPFGGSVCVDPVQEQAVFYGIEHSNNKETKLTLYEFDEKFKMLPKSRQSFTVPFAIVSEFGLTRDYAVFVVPPVVVPNPLQWLVSKDPGKVLQLDTSQPSQLVLVPRANSKKRRLDMFKIPLDDDFSDANLQFVNSYQDDGVIIVDAIRSSGSSSSEPPMAKWPFGCDALDSYQRMASKKSLWRYTLENGKVSKECLWEDHHVCFPTIHPEFATQPYQFAYMNIGCSSEATPPQGLAQFDVVQKQATASWMPAEPFEFCGPPVFAPKAGGVAAEADGYILSPLFNGQTKRSQMLVFDASNLAAGPVSRLPLGGDAQLPHFGNGGTGWFAPDCLPQVAQVQRRAKLADKMESRGSLWNEVKSDFSGLGLRLDDMEEYGMGDWFT